MHQVNLGGNNEQIAVTNLICVYGLCANDLNNEKILEKINECCPAFGKLTDQIDAQQWHCQTDGMPMANLQKPILPLARSTI